MKIRATQVEDATPFFAPVRRTCEVLAEGGGEGAPFPPESIPVFGVTSAVKHGLHAPGGFTRAVQARIINAAKWKALSPPDQAAIEKLLGENCSLLRGNLCDRTDAAAIEQMRKDDVALAGASPALAYMREQVKAREKP